MQNPKITRILKALDSGAITDSDAIFAIQSELLRKAPADTVTINGAYEFAVKIVNRHVSGLAAAY